jgi:hypothetical protein
MHYITIEIECTNIIFGLIKWNKVSHYFEIYKRYLIPKYC